MNTLINRLYGDYLMPSRLPLYEDFVRAASEAGYAHMSVREYIAALRGQGARPAHKVVVHRHDIDTDLRTARKLFDIEQKHRIHASYYFRLSTLDFALMNEIEEYGSEASYHYEELATYAKRQHIKDPAAIHARMADIRDEFARNLRVIEERFGRKLSTVASHGDFANRRLQISNTEILKDPGLRERCGIVCETYDRALLDHIDMYISDRPYPQYFRPLSPFDALGRHARICFLTHPRQWETNWIENSRDNLFRLYEGVSW
ncbi:hypothetical protein HF313_19075 [Massilia atriviolacea]|uniref:Polysaccharide deacetylase n=1 Tax=Massilia atriviolacea TaxID=2495579 RepID=A0A430HSV9_9BURK|nr:hypothetical protein [Massilia atriviolacea]RSZ60625.1 hypothetical protein EJB06_00315 [Massilia atriviolacea]